MWGPPRPGHPNYPVSSAVTKTSAFVTVPETVLVLFGLPLATSWTNLYGEKEKTPWMGPALNHMLSPGAKRRSQRKCVKWRWTTDLKIGPREKFFSLLFFLTSPQFQFPPSILIEVPVPSANHSMTAHLHTQIKFVPPCHFCTTSLLLQSRE